MQNVEKGKGWNIEMSLDVAIIDYKISNMFSVQSACSHFGLNAEITSDREKILNARAAILPGVGAFQPAMKHLNDIGLVDVINEFIATDKPFMGICLGLQLLMSESEEFGTHKGFNIIPGTVKKFPQIKEEGGRIKVPHIGWNRIKVTENNLSNWSCSPLENLEDGEFMYFVHSYYVEPQESEVILTQTEYASINFCSSLVYKNIFACQFHPEKSGAEGLKIIKNFSESIKNVGLNV